MQLYYQLILIYYRSSFLRLNLSCLRLSESIAHSRPCTTRHTRVPPSNLLLTNRSMDDRTMVDYDHALVRYSFFIISDRFTYGWSQTLPSVGLSHLLSFMIASHMVDDKLSLVWGFPYFNRFCSRHMVDHRFSLVWGSLRLAPISTFIV